MKKLGAFLLALLIGGAVLSTSPTAEAGQYVQTPGWYGNFTWGADGWPYGIQNTGSAITVEASRKGPGSVGWMRSPQLPSTLNLDAVNFSYNGSNGGGQSTGAVRLCYRNGYATGTLGGCAGGDLGYMAPEVAASAPIGSAVLCSSHVTGGGCAGAQFELTSNIGYTNVNGGYSWYGIVATIRDHSVPSPWAPHNGTLASSANTPSGRAWNSGNRTVGVFASDYNSSGLTRTQLILDGSPDASSLFNQGCNYGDSDWVPCADFTGNEATISTAGLTDGRHEAVTQATDAGHNVGTSGPSVFYTDNTAPATPTSVEVAGSPEGWSALNSFDVSWNNTGETAETETESGLASIEVDVEPTNPGTQVDPAPISVPVGGSASGITATTDSISGLTVPEAGQWTLRLATKDKAGNTSPVGDGSAGSPDSDHTIGFDPTPPAAPNGRANGWISRDELASGYDQEWDHTAGLDQFAPICGFAGKISQQASEDPGTSINIPGDVRKWRLPGDLTENTHFVHVRSVTCAGLASQAISSTEAKVDRTDPTPSYSGVTPGRWYKNGTQVTVAGSDALSGMAGAPAGDPFFDKGAYINYSVNGVSPAAPPRGGSATFPVVGEGAKTLRFSPVDLAGNKAKESVVQFGIDATSPVGYLEPQDMAKPTLIQAPLGDPTSGIEVSQIDVKPISGGSWTALPTSLAALGASAAGGNPKNAVASARFPDTTLPKGSYLIRVRAYDQAGNALVTDRDRLGRQLVVKNPMRSATNLTASLFRSKRLCTKPKRKKTKKKKAKRSVSIAAKKKKKKTKKKRSKRPRCTRKYRGKVIFIGGKKKLNVGYKRGAVLRGVLTDSRGRILRRQPIEVYTKARGKREILAGTTATHDDGAYIIKLRPGVSRSVRVHYPGTELRQSASTRVTLGTKAKMRMRVSKRRARTGQTVKFTGRVTSYDRAVPAGGKIIALQFYAKKKWRPAVALARTNKYGKFSVKYKFDGKRVKSRIVFRVIAPSEDGWGHATSASKRVTMKLNYGRRR